MNIHVGLEFLITGQDGERRADAWQMRSEFFDLRPEDGDALREFLDKWGHWYEPGEKPSQQWHKEKSGGRSPWSGLEEHRTGTLGFIRALAGDPPPPDPPESEIWKEQDRLKRALLDPVEEWLTGSRLAFEARPEYPHFYIGARSISKALRATVTLDLLARVKHRLCARKDCRKPFKVESKHSRRFCSQYCGHLESVRRGRREKKRAKRRQK